MVAVPAVLGSVAIVNHAVVVRIFRTFKEFFHQVNCIIEVVIVHVSAIDMNFALQRGTDFSLVALQDIA